MGHSVWLAIGFVLIVEGVGPLLAPKGWRNMMLQLGQQQNHQLRRFGGCLVISGIVICYFYLR
jgi:uncharacterized protein